ncbi:uncharacterized protein [Drosophila suzukii]|uniref:Uncharacterized protein n=1 Tax=Drosophila suzukii TaxID=28584 RepID=A0AB40ADX7_DROSZ|nr:uncharacterized protein LOC118878340 [Drosophila suzukii]
MCLILPLDCCGCFSPRSCQRQKQEQQEQHLQHQAKNYHSSIQLNELSSVCQVTTSQPSLSSLSPSLMALPHTITHHPAGGTPGGSPPLTRGQES